MKKMWRAILLSLASIVLFAASSQAEMIRAFADLWTQQTSSEYGLSVWVEATDSELKHPPDFVDSITVEGPDGSVELDLATSWFDQDGGFYTYIPFASPITDGVYTVTIVGGATTIICRDRVNGTLLDVPSITFPSEGATLGPTPLFRWGAVSGAKYYRIWLYDISAGEWVYCSWSGRRRQTNLSKFQMPLHVLKPNRNYRMRIEARSDALDLDKRSRSDWLNFSTRSW